MAAFLLINLQAGLSLPYGHPVLAFVKKEFPEVMVLDLDASSDDILVRYACTLIRESDKLLVYFYSTQAQAPLGTALKVVETIISTTAMANPIQILLEGEHTRLMAIFGARPHLHFISALSPDILSVIIKDFYKSVNSSASR